MKLFLFSVLLLAVGWFARDYVKVSYAAPTRSVSVGLPSLSVARPVQAPAPRAKAVPVAPKPVAAPKPVRATEQESRQELGRQIADNGLWRMNPVGTAAPGAFSSAWGGLHGQVHEPR